ncbi:MAG: ABC transporter ATP-binding protein [Clostridiaceae bacterium]|jgi:ABC-2 type transport system ATP-binding protein|nr:ABC transporter ATP-binding protein [Clostridiaceae bacterium]
MQTIKVCDVSKNYGDVQALQQVNLELARGKIYGLLGRNGAGKSTLLKIIAERIKPSSGRVLYDGTPTLDDVTSREIYFSEPENTLPEMMKVKDFCYYTSQFYPRFNLDEALQLLKEFGINEKKRLNQLSTGYYAIVRSIVALQTRAGFIFMDEPTLGHDAVNRELLYDEILRIYREEQNTIVLSTHLIDEVSNLLEEVILLDHGRIILEDSLEGVMDTHSYISGLSEPVRQIAGMYTVIDKKEDLGFTTLLVKKSKDAPAAPALPSGINVSQAGLQDIFIAYCKNQDK